MAMKQTVGRQGEELVADYIEQLNWQIVARNWRCQHGELDIVAYDNETLVFIEVRTRQGGPSMIKEALESVGPHKLQKLAELAMIYIDQELDGTDPMFRIDVFGVALHRGLFAIEHVRDAYQW